MPPRFAVLGAGDAGRALAATIASRGLEVALYSRSERRLADLRSGGLTLRRPDGREERVQLAELTVSLPDAVHGADAVIVGTNSTAHGELAARCAPLLRAGQGVVLVPGHTGGALEFHHRFMAGGGAAGVAVGETDALPFVCRAAGPATIAVLQEKRRIRLACLPTGATERVLGLLRAFLGNAEAAPNVLCTSFDNMTSTMQAPLLLFNAPRVERAEAFTIYREGISPAVARVMEAIDAERLAIAAEYGIRATSAVDWLKETYGASGTGLYECLMSTAGYAHVAAPTTLQHRFLLEHVPMGLVPLAALGALAGRQAPRMEAVIELASVLAGNDLRASGRSVERLGLTGLGVADVVRIATQPEPS